LDKELRTRERLKILTFRHSMSNVSSPKAVTSGIALSKLGIVLENHSKDDASNP